MAFVVASTVLHPILRASQEPARVLAVLSSAVYLQVEVDPADAGRRRSVIVAVLARDAVRVPLGLVVALPRRAAPFAALEAGCAALIGAGSVQLGGVSYQPLRYWDPAVPKLRAGLGTAAAMHRCGAIGVLTDQLPTDLGSALATAVLPLAEALSDRIPGPPGPARAARALTGLGPGLTPAGDDVLAGALLALAAAGDLPRQRALSAAVGGCLDRTGPLSAALLEQACLGRAVPEVTGLLRALAGAGDLDAALVALSLVGHTSGPALALGVRLALRARVGHSLGRAA
jgi:hypothetical protein